jgi:hypothetical protein
MLAARAFLMTTFCVAIGLVAITLVDNRYADSSSVTLAQAENDHRRDFQADRNGLNRALLKRIQETPQFHARGTHQCQSKTDIGHKCKVEGWSYHDCDQAFHELQQDDCCPSTKEGGGSIGFTLDFCSPI